MPPRLFFLCTSVWSSPPTRGPTLTGRCSWVPACARTTNVCGSSRALGPILPHMAPTRGDEAGQVLVLPRVLNACPRWRGTCPRRACGEKAQDWCRELIRVRGTRSKAAPHPTPLPAHASLGGAREQSSQDWLRSWRSSGAFLIVLPSQTTPTQAIFMIAVLPQTGHRQRNASEVAGCPQSQFASECFMDWHSPCG